MLGFSDEDAERRIAAFRQQSGESLNVNYPLRPQPKITASPAWTIPISESLPKLRSSLAMRDAYSCSTENRTGARSDWRAATHEGEPSCPGLSSASTIMLLSSR